MKLAIMQPYVFPYIGYFQLINEVDKFIIYDDVDYIKQGWINRNRILVNGKSYLFTIPLADASSFRRIKDTRLNKQLYKDWVAKFYKTVDTIYYNAPYYEDVLSLLKKVFDKEAIDIGELATNSIKTTLSYLGIHTEIDSSSGVYSNQHLSGKERIIDICLKEKASAYINAEGGADLYNKEYFRSYNIDLLFLKPDAIAYKQFDNEFVPSLSIIDVMMFNSIQKIKVMLNKYSLE